MSDADDGAGPWIARPRPLHDPWRECRHARDGVGAPEEPSRGLNILAARGGSEPLPPEPEGRALVPEERTEASRARPATASVATDHDGAGSRQDQHARAPPQRSEKGRLSVGKHANTPRQGTQPAGEVPSLAPGPHAARGHDEPGHP